MKNLLIIYFCCLIHMAKAQTNHPTGNYDSALAKKLGADEYGMKHYVMAFLKSGPTQITINTDPAIQSGELVMELRPWYGSAALVEIVGLHQKIQKKSVADF